MQVDAVQDLGLAVAEADVVVVDATGDGDVFARAGAAFDSDIDEKSMHHSINVAWLWGGVDMNRWIAFRVNQPQ